MPRSPGEYAKEHIGDGLVLVPVEELNRWQEQLHSTFDLGFKAAGGTMIPDGARNMVELALTREQINALAAVAEDGRKDRWDPATHAALGQFLRNRQHLQEQKMNKRYSIVGDKHAAGGAKLYSLPPGAPVVLVREPTNQYDRNAIMVWVDGAHVGYIPKKQNAELAARIDREQLAMDAAVPTHPVKSIPAKFVRSPNSGFPMVEVSE